MGKEGKRRVRRVRGSGALFYSTTRSVYVARVIVGKKADGSGPQYVERSAATVEALQAKLATIGPPASGTTVGEWCERWLTEMVCRPRTREIRVTAVTRRIVPVLGHLRVSELTPIQVERACQEWGKPGALAPNTVRMTASVLRTALTAACRVGLRSDNPVSHARLPKGAKTKLEPFSPNELSRIIREAAKRPVTHCLALLASTGCRIGEALALNVEDFDGASVSISRTQHPDRSSGPPKSDNGIRVIPVPDAALPALKAAKGKRTSGPLFLDKHGGRMIHHRAQYAWKCLLLRLKLPFRACHKLRHSVASGMVADGWPLAEVGRYLGDSVAVVVATYLHAAGKFDARAASNRMLAGKGGQVRGGKATSGKLRA